MRCTITLWITFVIFFGYSATNEIYKRATEMVDQRHATNLKLYEQYKIDLTDYAARFYTESGPSKYSLNYRKADILLEYLRLVKDGYSYNTSELSNYLQRRTHLNDLNKSDYCQKRTACDPNEKFRSYGGFCNSLQKSNLGAVGMNYIHTLEPAYADGIHSLRRTATNEELPNVRLIGNIIEEADRSNDPPLFIQQLFEDDFIDMSAFRFNRNSVRVEWYNLLGLMLGQLIGHDMGNRATVQMKGGGSTGMRCCSKSFDSRLPSEAMNPDCIPIDIPHDDHFYGSESVFCQNFIRMQSTLSNKCKFTYAQPQNVISSYVDLSIIYSDDEVTVRELRSFNGGLFKLYKNILPRTGDTYTGGDPRVTQTAQLALVHSLCYRLHNFIAENLMAIKRNWNDEQLFSESRRITIAIYQSVIYNEWLPAYIGKSYIETRNITRCKDFDPNIDPSTSVEFSHSAFRSLHGKLPSTIQFVDATNTIFKEMNLSDTVGATQILENYYDELLRGMTLQSISTTFGYTNEIRDKLFKTMFRGKAMGIDLFSFDVMRGRDSGTPSYPSYFDFCASTKINTWKDMRPFFTEKNFYLLRNLYRNPNDVDLLVGIMLEQPTNGMMGPIGACIIEEQFYRSKCGDRFFYKHPSNPYPFTLEQINEIEATTFAKWMCMVTGIAKTPTSFNNNLLKDCKQIQRFKFDVFK